MSNFRRLARRKNAPGNGSAHVPRAGEAVSGSRTFLTERLIGEACKDVKTPKKSLFRRDAETRHARHVRYPEWKFGQRTLVVRNELVYRDRKRVLSCASNFLVSDLP
jgi:hypothetical protein